MVQVAGCSRPTMTALPESNRVQTLNLTTPDGQVLSARVYEPEGPPHRVVLLASAMGVYQRFYAPFAQWLTRQGVAVLTFDWRGMGDSAPARLRGFKASIEDWALLDLPAAVAAMRQRWPDVPATYVGHSLGGQVFGWPGIESAFERVLTVAAGSGYWRLNAAQVRWRSPVLWWVLAPVAIALTGYFPGNSIKVVGDLPAGAMWQWRRWCLHPDYLGAEGPQVLSRYAQVTTPITAVVMDDDELVSPAGVHDLYRLYAAAPVQFVTPRRQDHGMRRIGHFGLFHPKAEASLWPQTYQWLCSGA